MGMVRIVLKVLLAIIVVLVALVGGYVIYLQLNYGRIADNLELDVDYFSVAENKIVDSEADSAVSPEEHALAANTKYVAFTFNIGFGAYDKDFSFFMDKGAMKDGTETVGSESRAASKEAATRNTEAVIRQTLGEDPDIALFQEADVSADRSYNVNQTRMITDAFTQNALLATGGTELLSWSYATNFHTAYLFYPPTKPIGYIRDSGLLTISKYMIDSAVRRSFPVSDAFPTK
ncbi:MAG: hypothetical protein LBH63_02365, partial [Clostridiales Family XIII bacterium]|nr:hypothetical protein [Clostridiales Family XIII bacterium]